MRRQFLGAAVIWVSLLGYVGPLWQRWGVGTAQYGGMKTWPATWAFSLLSVGFWPLVAACSVGSLLCLQAAGALREWITRRRASIPRRASRPPEISASDLRPDASDPDPGAGTGKTDRESNGHKLDPNPGARTPQDGESAQKVQQPGPGTPASEPPSKPRAQPPRRQRRAVFAEAMEELDGLIGLATVKQEVRRLVAHVRVTQERQRRGLRTESLSLHMAFLGRPGTGKTEVARIIGRLFYGLGLLDSGHLVETDRSGLVGEYIGHTAQKTRKRVGEAVGGVLFVDEAYALAPREGTYHDFGYEAIDTLVKEMEDRRNQLVVILAGYPAEMDRLWAGNPGLKSRVRYQITFPDYSVDELASILYSMATARGYRLTVDTSVAARAWLERVCSDSGFANARSVRNFLECAIIRQSVRCDQAGVRRLSDEELTTLLPEDLAEPMPGQSEAG